jgi:tetratricopeptide (TPR) repeat protein
MVEASQMADLVHSAEQAYLEFQSLQSRNDQDLGGLYRQQGRLTEAQAFLERSVEVSLFDFISIYHLARGQSDTALASFRVAAEAIPGWRQANMAFGKAFLAFGEPDEAATQYHLAQIADMDTAMIGPVGGSPDC